MSLIDYALRSTSCKEIGFASKLYASRVEEMLEKHGEAASGDADYSEFELARRNVYSTEAKIEAAVRNSSELEPGDYLDEEYLTAKSMRKVLDSNYPEL